MEALVGLFKYAYPCVWLVTMHLALLTCHWLLVLLCLCTCLFIMEHNSCPCSAGYGSDQSYNSGYGSGMYGSSYGGFGGSYSSRLYGNNMYRVVYGGLYGGSMYGGGMRNGSFGGPMGGYGMGSGPFGNQDPNNPYGGPPSPPGFWISFLQVMEGIVNFFGQISILIDQNTRAFHMCMSALLQVFVHTGLLYGELARFVLRLLGIKTKPRKVERLGPHGLPAPHNPRGNQNYIEGSKAAPNGAWDNVWGNEASG